MEELGKEQGVEVTVPTHNQATMGSVRMQHARKASRVIWYEVFAFSMIILCSWMNEYSGLEGVLLEDNRPLTWIDPAIESAITILVAVPTVMMSRRLTERLYYLEGFLKICAWCRQVGKGDEWVAIEEFLETDLHAKTSHGMCPSCRQSMREANSAIVD